jgi:hypothetical protein
MPQFVDKSRDEEKPGTFELLLRPGCLRDSRRSGSPNQRVAEQSCGCFSTGATLWIKESTETLLWL